MKKILVFLLLVLPGLLFSQVAVDMGASARGSDVIILTDTTSAASRYGRLYYYSGNYYAGNTDGTYDILPNPPTGSIADGYVPTWNATTGKWQMAAAGSGAHVQANWISNYTSSKDTLGIRSRPKFRPMGNAVGFDGTNYAYHADDDIFDVGKEDFAFSTWIKFPIGGTDWSTLFGKGITSGYSTSDSSWGFVRRNTDNDVEFMSGLDDASAWGFRLQILGVSDGWHFFSVVRDGADAYAFLDGIYYEKSTIAEISNFSNSSTLDVSKHDSTYMDETRLSRFGVDGYTTTGTGGTDLEIRVGDASGDIIYSEVYPYSPANPGGMIPLMYKNPSADLGDIGYSSLENADRTNKLTGDNTDFESSIGSWTAVQTEVLAHETTITHNSSSGAMKVTFDGSALYGGTSPVITLPPDIWYEFSAYVYLETGFTNGNSLMIFDGSSFSGHTLITHSHSGVTGQWERINCLIKAVSTDTTGKVYFKVASTPANGDIMYVDDVKVRRIGEVAHLKMNESGTPATLTDATDNSLDLTTSGSPSMEANDYESLSLVRANADTVFADTLNSRAGEFTDIYLGSRSAAPGAGTAKPLIYASSGEIWVHDASGNNKIISPHMGKDWVFNSWNSNSGERTFINMIDLIKSIESLTGKKLIYRDTVAVEIPDSVAADTLYKTVYDSLTQKNTKIRIIRAKKGYYKLNGKYYQIKRTRIAEPPDEYKKDHIIGLGFTK